MKRFFFHVRRNNVLFEDTRGKALSGLPAARAWAMTDARSLINEDALDGDLSTYWIDIADASGTRLATMPIAGVAEQRVGLNE
ncbi:DUF6894 family protein [Devosia sp. CN2-171]|jgi:hypothetical protein|uniref:DUF6894 family protein n=1 Tax=Devosia sp. CN2-171 TaxID=3400909 RepID=UPI003BF7B0BC